MNHARRFGLSAYPGLFLLQKGGFAAWLTVQIISQRANSIELEFYGIPYQLNYLPVKKNLGGTIPYLVDDFLR